MKNAKRYISQHFDELIIKIEETNTKNKFEIKVNGKSKYLAGIPWIELDKQLDVNKNH